MKITDRNGNELKVGDKVVWASKGHGNVYLRVGVIQQLDFEVEKKIVEYEDYYTKHMKSYVILIYKTEKAWAMCSDGNNHKLGWYRDYDEAEDCIKYFKMEKL